MNWLITYGPRPCNRIVSLIVSYQQNLSTLDDTIERLDDALDIWSFPHDAWADPDVLLWARIFSDIETSRHGGRALSSAKYAELTTALSSLKLQAQQTYCKAHYASALYDIAEYEQGKLPLDVLANHTFWRLVYNLEEFISDSAYKLLQDRAAGLEKSCGRAYEWQKHKPTKEELKHLDTEVEQGKVLLLSLMSNLDLEQI